MNSKILGLIVGLGVSASAIGTAMAEDGERGTLRWGTFIPPTFPLNPDQAIPAGTMAQLTLMYDSLVVEDLDGMLEPSLATSWTIDGSTITMQLREGVVFHDGTPFDAEAVKANLEHTQANALPPIAFRLNSIDSVEVIGSHEVRLNLKSPDPVLIYALARQPGMMISPQGLETANTTPLGTGPYVYNADAGIDGSLYHFDAFDGFYDLSQQGFDAVQINGVPEPVARAAALTNGDMDGVHITGADAAALTEQGFTVSENKSVVFALVPMDRDGTMAPELADPLVREALQYAVDREALVDVIEGGIGSVTNQLYSDPASPWHIDDLTNYTYDPDKASALLEEAGVSDLEVDLPVAFIFGKRTQALGGLLQNVGISANLVPVDLPHVATYLSGNFGMVYAPVEVLHPKDFLEQYMLPRGLFNPFGVEDPELMALFEEASAAAPEDADALWTELLKQFTEANNIIFVANFSGPVVTGPNLEGVNLRMHMPATPTWRSMRFAD
ncbi:peptide/nickel transport system substrate-binding protein [Octadecabacter temperatus]|uniref:Nickel-binding periplasmic protein n=1 Tax=Octadecabacter temperatus TaxID=1458307 RepID=A0A0K0Y4H5_9RHOB|nr:ABC transporter substrate-binding protein [Octadecabacter temperatus]AKS45859.1 Nickel-binding periplasmic protein precursor [Octadecabacter temperatus]SIO02163.1 peptide/nickel transport system substrate-binding protein [Octadecabacter temperatus]